MPRRARIFRGPARLARDGDGQFLGITCNFRIPRRPREFSPKIACYTRSK